MVAKRDISGMVVGKLTVIKRLPSIKSKSYWETLCECGNVKSIRQDHLTCAKVVSCGCTLTDILVNRNTKHNLSRDRNYLCWQDMKRRASRRTSCNIYEPWLNDYTAFREWSMANGYTESKILCRNGDVGDYTPHNCRWGSYQENAEESHAKHWTIYYPDGNINNIINLERFCREHHLSISSMRKVSKGLQKHHRMYKCTEYKGEHNG